MLHVLCEQDISSRKQHHHLETRDCPSFSSLSTRIKSKRVLGRRIPSSGYRNVRYRIPARYIFDSLLQLLMIRHGRHEPGPRTWTVLGSRIRLDVWHIQSVLRSSCALSNTNQVTPTASSPLSSYSSNEKNQKVVLTSIAWLVRTRWRKPSWPETIHSGSTLMIISFIPQNWARENQLV